MTIKLIKAGVMVSILLSSGNLGYCAESSSEDESSSSISYRGLSSISAKKADAKKVSSNALESSSEAESSSEERRFDSQAIFDGKVSEMNIHRIKMPSLTPKEVVELSDKSLYAHAKVLHTQQQKIPLFFFLMIQYRAQEKSAIAKTLYASMYRLGYHIGLNGQGVYEVFQGDPNQNLVQALFNDAYSQPRPSFRILDSTGLDSLDQFVPVDLNVEQLDAWKSIFKKLDHEEKLPSQEKFILGQFMLKYMSDKPVRSANAMGLIKSAAKSGRLAAKFYYANLVFNEEGMAGAKDMYIQLLRKNFYPAIAHLVSYYEQHPVEAKKEELEFWRKLLMDYQSLMAPPLALAPAAQHLSLSKAQETVAHKDEGKKDKKSKKDKKDKKDKQSKVTVMPKASSSYAGHYAFGAV